MIGRLFRRFAEPPRSPVHCEYWIFTSERKLPPQELLLSRLLRNNPYDSTEPKALGPEHGLLFSDIRLSMGLVLRERNPHLFRPDLFERHIAVDAGLIEALSEAEAMVRVRYVSKEAVQDRRYLRLMPFLAEAAAYYARSKVLFNMVSEQLLSSDALRAQLEGDPMADRSELHLRTVWIESAESGRAETRGLGTVGLPDLQTPPSPNADRTTICSVLDLAASTFWDRGELQEETPVEFLEGQFLVRLERRRQAPVPAHVMRVHEP